MHNGHDSVCTDLTRFFFIIYNYEIKSRGDVRRLSKLQPKMSENGACGFEHGLKMISPVKLSQKNKKSDGTDYREIEGE